MMEEDKMIGEYRIRDKIGEGSFGQIYEVEKDSKIYAIKTEHIGNVKPMVVLEYQIFKQLQEVANLQHKGYGFPKVYDYCEKDHFAYMVMDKLDLTLQVSDCLQKDLANVQLQNKIEKDLLVIIMYNTLKCLEMLHQIGYVYRDVKPSNFMLNRAELQADQSKIYLIDLGLCKKYIKKDSKEHIAMKTNKRMIGTPIFCSLNTHKGIQGSRRDDLESWVYMSIYLVKKLPWQANSVNSLPSTNKNDVSDHKESVYEKIAKMKASTNINQLIREQPRIPLCLIKILDYIRHLEFETKPNYEFIYRLLQQQHDKLTNQKTPLTDIHFKLKTSIIVKEPKQVKKIKINFKIPEGKIKQKKKVTLQDINLHAILQK